LLSLCAYFVQLLLVTSVIFLPSNPSRRRRFSVLLAIQPISCMDRAPFPGCFEKKLKKKESQTTDRKGC
jgi:hypothetical protein